MAIAFVYLIGRRLGGARVGLVAAGFLAIHPSVISSAAEARSYAATIAVSAMGSWLYLRMIQRPSNGRAAAYGSVAGLSVGLHYLALLVPIAHAVHWLGLRGWRDTVSRRAALLASLCALLLISPLLVFRPHATDQIDWIAELNTTQVLYLAKLFGNKWMVGTLACISFFSIINAIKKWNNFLDNQDWEWQYQYQIQP